MDAPPSSRYMRKTMTIDPAVLAELQRAHLSVLEREATRVMETHRLTALAIHSGFAPKKSVFDDQNHPFRVSPPFSHWVDTPLEDAWIVLRPGHRPMLVWQRQDSFWESPQSVSLEALSGVLDVTDTTPGAPLDGALLGSNGACIVESDAALERVVPHGKRATAEVVQALEVARVRKSPYEIACIREANRIAARGHKAVREAFMSGESSELALHLAYLAATEQDDCETPYKNIVAIGAHAATLHHVHYARGQGIDKNAPTSLLVDAGATFRGYASDITRTWVRGEGASADAFRALVDGIDALERAIVGEITVGMPYEALHNRAHERLGALLVELGWVRTSAEEAVDKGITRAIFPHGLGHSLGLQVHDVGCRLTPPSEKNPFLRNTSQIAEGQVFTIEPGAYIIDALITPLLSGELASSIDASVIVAIRPFGGVRIEDDIAVTFPAQSGDPATDNLTRPWLS